MIKILHIKTIMLKNIDEACYQKSITFCDFSEVDDS